MEDLQAAFYENDNHAGGHLSYSEFYITVSDIRVLNSNGVDISFTSHKVFVETAIHWRGEQETEIEISESYSFSLPANISDACEMLKARIAHLFTVAKEKSIAVPTPKVEDINILLTGECLATFFNYYSNRSNAGMIYQQMSTYEAGVQVQGKNPETCDRITLILDPTMEGSSFSRPWDEHGLPLTSHTIIQGGKLLKIWGDTRFSSYLNIPATGNISNVCVTGGTATQAELRRGPYLELVSFSDFQTNPITGDFGSEIRLGFYHDGEKTVPVTGGSISGNMAAVHDTMRMSKEERQYNHYRGPATICIRGASISGVIS